MTTDSDTPLFEVRDIEITAAADLATLWSEEILPALNSAGDPEEEMSTAKEFLRAVARLEYHQDYLSSVDAWKSRVAEVIAANKSSVNELYDHVVRKVVAEAEATGCDRVPVDEYIKHHVEALYIIKSTDSNVATRYQWHFDSGDVIETKKEWKQEHQMKEILYDEVGTYATDATVDDYTDWIKTWVIQHKQVETVRGARTAAAEDLQSAVGTYAAYTDRAIAAQEGQCYVEDSSDHEMVEVSNQVVKRICEDHGLGNAANLHAELQAMNVLVRNARKTTLPSGAQMTWWCLDPEWVTPREVIVPEENSDDADTLFVQGGGT